MRYEISIAAMMAATLFSAIANAQPAQGQNPLSQGARRSYDIIKNYVTKAADKMPEDQYAFKPSPDVRTFGQLVGHVADANFMICGMAAGEKPPMGGMDPATSLEKTKTTKADLTKVLAESFAYCDKVHSAMTDTGGTQQVKFFTGDMPKLSVLEFNTHHDFEHYGNMVTYLRIKGIVPPSSEGRPPTQ